VIGTGAEITARLTPDQERVLEEARRCSDDRIRAANRWHYAGEATGWLSFALTAMITLLAGAYGRTPSNAPAAEALEAVRNDTSLPARRRARIVWTIGVLAATASILTAAAGRCKEEARELYSQAAAIDNARVTA